VERIWKGGRRKGGEKEEETGKKEVPSPDAAFIFPGRGSKTTFSAGFAKAGCRGSTPGHAAVLQNNIGSVYRKNLISYLMRKNEEIRGKRLGRL
jgi:hypothetical protein